MRTIIFRGHDGNYWRYGSLVDKPARPTIFYFKFFYKVDPISVGQYTGLKDKNEKDIYEGDIVKMYHRWNDEPITIIGVVRYNDTFARFEIKCRGARISFKDNTEDCEIIGNVYENEDLLKH